MEVDISDRRAEVGQALAVHHVFLLSLLQMVFHKGFGVLLDLRRVLMHVLLHHLQLFNSLLVFADVRLDHATAGRHGLFVDEPAAFLFFNFDVPLVEDLGFLVRNDF